MQALLTENKVRNRRQKGEVKSQSERKSLGFSVRFKREVNAMDSIFSSPINKFVEAICETDKTIN